MAVKTIVDATTNRSHLQGYPRHGTELFDLCLFFILIVELRKRLLNLPRNLACNFYIHQRPLIQSRTILCKLAPFAGLGQNLRPVGERAALQRLYCMYRAAGRTQKRTLLVALLAKAQQRLGAAKIAPLEFRTSNAEMFCQSCNVIAGNVNETLRLATADASGLALKTHGQSVS